MKTIDERAEEFADKTYPISEYGLIFPSRSIIHSAFISGAEFAQRWILMSEELPNDFEKIMIKDHQCGCHLGHIDNGAVIIPNRFGDCRISPISYFSWRPIEYK